MCYCRLVEKPQEETIVVSLNHLQDFGQQRQASLNWDLLGMLHIPSGTSPLEDDAVSGNLRSDVTESSLPTRQHHLVVPDLPMK